MNKRWWMVYGIIITVAIVTMAQQPRVWLDSTDYFIGDQAKYHVAWQTADSGQKVELLTDQWNLPEDVELIRQSSVYKSASQGSYRFQRDLTLAFFDTGRITIPPLPMSWAGGQTVRTNPLAIQVHSVVADTAMVAPIKPIIKEPWHVMDIWPLLVVVLLIGAAWWWYLYKKRQADAARMVVETVPPVPPYEEAMVAINKLPVTDHLTGEELKQYAATLSMIYRTYLDRAFHIDAVEHTTTEIWRQMQTESEVANSSEPSRELLDELDLVKYAKYIPTSDRVAALVPRTRTLIEGLHVVEINEEEEE